MMEQITAAQIKLSADSNAFKIALLDWCFFSFSFIHQMI
jgi:hypothetical protein